MVRIRFILAGGAEHSDVDAADGACLLNVAQAAGMPLEGTCEGQMACSTCHVIIDSQDFDRLPPASSDEEDMLDLAAGARRTSRLACQITLTPELEGLCVHIPPESRNMQEKR